MSVQDLYFRIMRMACSALSGHTDPFVRGAFERLGGSLALMDLRLAGTQSLTLDRKGSGLPILSEAVSLMLDVRNGVECRDAPDAVRREMLDFMMARRRRPEPALVARMGRALYAQALGSGRPEVFETEPQTVPVAASPWAPHDAAAAWDFWDGVAMRPVAVRCGFSVPSAIPPDAATRLAEVARLFSGGQFKPVTLANEIDERLPEIRLKELAKLTIGPFRSAIFTEGEGGFAPFLSEVEDSAMAWTLGFSVERIVSAGTQSRGGGFFTAARPYEAFAVDTLDIDRAQRGVSDFDDHVLMPHAVYQILADAPDGARLLQGRRVHVLSGPECTLTEDV